MARISRFSRKPRFRRFRRKQRNVWFPVLGARWVNGQDTYPSSNFYLRTDPVQTVLAFGADIQVTAITKDFTQEPSSAVSIAGDASLRDVVEGQSWMLTRLVGKLHLTCRSDAGDPLDPAVAWGQVLVTAGFFVAPADDTDQNFPAASALTYDPANVDNIQNPWIWRQSWILGSPLTTQIGLDNFPMTNESTQPSGPFFDSKVKRRIQREHRLWFVLSTIGWDGLRSDVSGSTENQPYIDALLDVRVLGHMVRARNTSSF